MLKSEARIVEPEDGGAILVDSVVSDGSVFTANLRLKPEACLEPSAGSTFKQWFYFEVQGMPVGEGSVATFTIADAGDSTFSDWRGYKVGADESSKLFWTSLPNTKLQIRANQCSRCSYLTWCSRVPSHHQLPEQVCCSRDGETWTRVGETKFDARDAGSGELAGSGALTWTLRDNVSSGCEFAYFPPYALERQRRLMARAQAQGLAKAVVLGQSCDGRDLPCLVFGGVDGDGGGGGGTAPAPGKAVVWIQGRQHPGEVAASWFVEGAVERLLELAAEQRDAVDSGGGGGGGGGSGGLLAGATVFVVPNLNPDGGKRGHLRTNAQV